MKICTKIEKLMFSVFDTTPLTLFSIEVLSFSLLQFDPLDLIECTDILFHQLLLAILESFYFLRKVSTVIGDCFIA